jgi:hypothetical protein
VAVASRADRAQCLMTAVVPAHRCGAVPDSHRVPSCDDRPGWAAEPARTRLYREPCPSPSPAIPGYQPASRGALRQKGKISPASPARRLVTEWTAEL